MLQNRRPIIVLLWAIVLMFASLSINTSSAETRPLVLRLALVNIADNILRPLLADFEVQTGFRAEIIYSGSDPFSVAKAGRADLVISHYGHPGVEPFVTSGLGLWPHPVFANQMALFGPPNDPAHVRGMTDAAQAFARIAAVKAPFVVNDGIGARYLEDILWRSAGVQVKGDWYIDPKADGKDAVEIASRKGAYVLWGIPPFLKHKRQIALDLEPLVVGDSLFQRIMVSIVVNPAKVQGTNAEGARSFVNYLISTASQARIRAFRYPDFDQQAWWPAGRHNSTRE